jgi:hypothetical protein
MKRSAFRIWISCATAVTALAIPAMVTAADKLVAKGGPVLSGTVKSVTSKGVEFQPDFAKDPMLVPWDNIEDLETEASYQILHGENGDVTAPITDFDDGKVEAGDVEIEPASIVSATAIGDDGMGFLDRTRASWRYWHGGFNLGFNLQQATNDTLGLYVGFSALRTTDRTRLILGTDYRYSTERDPDNSPPRKRRNKDAVSALVRGEYDIYKHLFVYASTDALYDAIQNLSLRAVPKAGLGYVFWEREPKEGVRDFFLLEAGGGWVYEKYIDNCDGEEPDDPCIPPGVPIDEDDDYFTVAFGAAAAVLLPRGAMFDWRFDYLPSVSDFADDYVIRTSAGLTVPLIAPVSARLGITDTYDSTPSSGAEENSLYLDTTLSLVW